MKIIVKNKPSDHPQSVIVAAHADKSGAVKSPTPGRTHTLNQYLVSLP